MTIEERVATIQRLEVLRKKLRELFTSIDSLIDSIENPVEVPSTVRMLAGMREQALAEFARVATRMRSEQRALASECNDSVAGGAR